MSTKANRPSLREEFRQWFRVAPRVWLIIGAVVLAATAFRGTLGALALTALILAVVLGALFVLPAIIGAIAGSTVRDVVFWVRVRRHRRQVRRYDRAA